jgi:hypothetical protein
MAGKNNFDKEIRSSIKEKETPADLAADKKKGIKQGSPEDLKADNRLSTMGGGMSDRSGKMNSNDPGMHPMPGAKQAVMGNPENMARMQHAAGIAHAILGGRKMV